MDINVAPAEIHLNVEDPTVNLTLDLNSFHSTNGGGGVSYTHSQSSPASTWTINHNLGLKPSIQLYNTGSQLITGNVVHTSDFQTVVYFSSSVAGYARLN